VSETVEEVLSKVEQVIDLGGYDIIKKYFSLNGLNNFFDFHYLKLNDFKVILSKSKKLINFYKKQTGESFSKISSEGILKFAKKIGLERPNYSEIKNSIKSKLQSIGVTYLNEFNVLSLNEFKKIFLEDNEIKYFCYRVFKKSIVDINTQDYKDFGEKLELEYLEKDKFFSIIKDRLKDKKINYLDDLTLLSVREFDKIVGMDLLIESYFLSINIYKSFIKKDDIRDFGISIGLKSKEIDRVKYIKSFLSYNKIFNFNDLKDYHKTEIRTLLWEDSVCREILEGFGLNYLQDYRLEHLKRFSRFVGLDGVPKDFELDEEKSKNLILNKLKQNGVECIYSLKLNGLKGFRRIFKLKDIGNIYQDINTFIKNHIGKTIPNLTFDDLENIGNLLGLEALGDLEHKKKVSDFLLKKGVWLKDLNKNNFRKDNTFWFNPNLRYFLDKIGGPTDIKELRPIHIDNMRDYINGL
ncbi:MAG: hypothetical protein PHV23_06115, partial [Candidatus Gracilibacteria bacterium]|nr:hypothetical protein [Candidatus Gracilibacteria bacterium]